MWLLLLLLFGGVLGQPNASLFGTQARTQEPPRTSREPLKLGSNENPNCSACCCCCSIYAVISGAVADSKHNKLTRNIYVSGVKSTLNKGRKGSGGSGERPGRGWYSTSSSSKNLLSWRSGVQKPPVESRRLLIICFTPPNSITSFNERKRLLLDFHHAARSLIN